ncbi:MAG TPA: DUF424 family protein [Candidatus Nanoarchaeia archaeon]|nr:DUF424 family protein [Candidatus Nanoarchaeia archaeon]
MISVNIIKAYRDVVAICDSDLLGKKFEDNNFQLDLKESFYKGKEVNGKELIGIIEKMIGEDATFNIVGEESIKIALKIGIINKNGIKEIQGVPFALVLL